MDGPWCSEGVGTRTCRSPAGHLVGVGRAEPASPPARTGPACSSVVEFHVTLVRWMTAAAEPGVRSGLSPRAAYALGCVARTRVSSPASSSAELSNLGFAIQPDAELTVFTSCHGW